MNKVILIGRLTKDPETRYTTGENAMAIAKYTLAVERKVRNSDGNKEADFINCVAFGKNGEFAEKYFRKGMKVAMEGRIQTGSYTDRDGKKIYTTDVIVDTQEFVESKKESEEQPSTAPRGYGDVSVDQNGFMSVPDNIDEELPFN